MLKALPGSLLLLSLSLAGIAFAEETAGPAGADEVIGDEGIEDHEESIANLPEPAAPPAERTSPETTGTKSEEETEGFATPDAPGQLLSVSSPEDAKLRLSHNNLTALATNPLRLADYYYLTLQHRLFDREGDLYKGNHFGIGFAPFLTPAGLHPGATVSFKPLAILHLQSSYRKMWWFGNFDQIARLADVGADASDATLEAIGGRETFGSEWVNSATLAAKVKNVALRYQGVFTKVDYDLGAGEDAFYHPQLDIAVDNDGWMVSHNLALLGFFKGDTWIAGARYQESQSRSADYSTLHIRQRQLGPFIAHRLKEGTDTYRRPTVFLWPTWWLDHPYRAGQETEAWVPTIFVGYAFSGTLWSQD